MFKKIKLIIKKIRKLFEIQYFDDHGHPIPRDFRIKDEVRKNAVKMQDLAGDYCNTCGKHKDNCKCLKK